MSIQSLIHKGIRDQRGDDYVYPRGDLEGVSEVRIGRVTGWEPDIRQRGWQPPSGGGGRENVIQEVVEEIVTPLLVVWEGQEGIIIRSSIVKGRQFVREVIRIASE